MPKYLLQLLLIVSLVLNASLAPWAMAGMLGGHHPVQQSLAAPCEGHAQDHPADHGHAPCHDAAMDRQHSKNDRCCDGALCQCGCVLPPALSLASVELAPPPLITLGFQPLRRAIAAHHQAPLLRPPAV